MVVSILLSDSSVKWVPLTMTWNIHGSQMEETASRYGGQLQIYWINSKTAENGRSSSLGIGQGANNSSPEKNSLLQNIT
jgi:hypothetical protein